LVGALSSLSQEEVQHHESSDDDKTLADPLSSLVCHLRVAGARHRRTRFGCELKAFKCRLCVDFTIQWAKRIDDQDKVKPLVGVHQADRAALAGRQVRIDLITGNISENEVPGTSLCHTTRFKNAKLKTLVWLRTQRSVLFVRIAPQVNRDTFLVSGEREA